MVKTIASGLLVLGLLAVQVSEADAAACAAAPTGRDASVRTARSACIAAMATTAQPSCGRDMACTATIGTAVASAPDAAHIGQVSTDDWRLTPPR
jgi:hypothetical protein